MLSYAHYALNDNSLAEIIPLLKSKGIGIVNAAALSMGMLFVWMFSCCLLFDCLLFHFDSSYHDNNRVANNKGMSSSSSLIPRNKGWL